MPDLHPQDWLMLVEVLKETIASSHHEFEVSRATDIDGPLPAVASPDVEAGAAVRERFDVPDFDAGLTECLHLMGHPLRTEGWLEGKNGLYFRRFRYISGMVTLGWTLDN